MGNPAMTTGPARIADRRADIRYIGSLNGCYTLSDRRDPKAGGLEVYACRVQGFAQRDGADRAVSGGKAGEVVAAHGRTGAPSRAIWAQR